MSRALVFVLAAACSLGSDTTPASPTDQAAPPSAAQVDWLAAQLDVAPYNFLTLDDAAPFDARVSTLEAGDAANQALFADLTARIAALEAAGGSGTGGPAAVTMANFASLQPTEGSSVHIGETLTLSGDWDGLDVDQLQVNGGGIVGTPGIEVDLGSDSTFTNTHFEDVILDGRDITFVNCSFSGAISFPSDSHLVGGSVSNVVQGTVRKLESIVGTEIDDSTLVRVGRIVDADIDTSVLGGQTVNANSLARLSSSTVNDTVVYPSRGGTITGNDFDDVTVFAGATHFGPLTVTGNTFNGVFGAEIASIYIDAESSNYAQVTVTGNSFMGNSTVPSHITIVGNATGSYQGISISANVFMRGTVAVDAQSNVPTFVHGNAMLGTTQNLGAANVQVSGNHVF